MGLAVTGAAVARHLLASGVPVLAADDDPGPAVRERAGALGIRLVEAPTAEALAELAAEVGLVVVSPGVPAGHPALSLAVPTVSEVELAGRLASARGLPMVAVTGTNGKTTVTTLVVQMLVAAGRRAVAAGNIGAPLVEAAAGEAEVVVAEVSSFQLALTERFRPRVGLWLNVAEDHLDWHPSMAHYVEAKARIWANQGAGDLAVANADDPVVMGRAVLAPAESLVTFGTVAGVADAGYREVDGWLLTPGGEPILAVRDMWRALPHDRSNALAACAAALAAGATLEACRSVLSTFPGLHHRVELVGEAGGVRWYDDSKATTPASVLAALAGFDSVVLIAGGRNKGLDLAALAAGAERVRAVVAIGEAAAEVEAAFSGAGSGAAPGAAAGAEPGAAAGAA
ncbi:MAG: UDP-N-acetylmuramoyl-L-alanine--D-glutamate ligase, partial [Acidimicrobiales bacterium]